jgi:hypothetical protein
LSDSRFPILLSVLLVVVLLGIGIGIFLFRRSVLLLLLSLSLSLVDPPLLLLLLSSDHPLSPPLTLNPKTGSQPFKWIPRKTERDSDQTKRVTPLFFG